jgi:F-type H+-transporting ATPase subunit gamma
MDARRHGLALAPRIGAADRAMSRLGNVERRRRSLAEIREIMNSLKSLAYMETRKLGRFVEAQRAISEQIEQAADDLVSFYPAIVPKTRAAVEVHIIVGTERGFCGDFNERLLEQVRTSAPLEPPRRRILLAIGQKLESVLESLTPAEEPIVFVEGASVAEEVGSVLARVVGELDSLRDEHGILSVSTSYHHNEVDITRRALLPPFEEKKERMPAFAHPPCLNLRPADLLVELADAYLVARLHEILYASLLNENQHRVTHLGAAVKHLDDKLAGLAHRVNTLRQEEITEEIEVILLSAVELAESHLRPADVPAGDYVA